MWFCIITSLCCSCGFICSHIYDLIFRKTPDVCNEIIFFFSLKHVSHAVGFTPLSCTVQELALTLVQPSQLIPGLFTPQGSPHAMRMLPLLLEESVNRGLLTPPTSVSEMENSGKENIRLICTSQEANYGNTDNLGRGKISELLDI